MEKDVKTKQKKIVKRSYIARDFDGFKQNLVRHARTFFPNNIEDFTEAGLGGMFVDMLAYVGDSLSFYLDHQFNELRWSDAIEVENVKKHLQLAGVESPGASPSIVYVKIVLRIPIDNTSNSNVKESALPTIKKGSKFRSSNGITFNLMRDVDFTEKVVNSNKFLWEEAAQEQHFKESYAIISRYGFCVSGEIREEIFSIGDSFVPFREIVLSEQNISLIESVHDSDGNVYYEVDNLAQDNVFTIFDNKNISNNSVEQSISVVPAPYRFTKYFDPQFLSTTLTFGGGDAMANDDDLLPDPADLSVPLYGKRVFSKFSLDPNSLLRTNTLGIAPRNVTLNVRYRYGGGFNHNVGVKSIKEITYLDLTFPTSVTHSDAIFVRSNLAITNDSSATGGNPPPSIDELRDQIPVARNSQNRIVTKEDLLSRIYSLPSGLGRVFRASISEAANSAGQIDICLISRDSVGKLSNFGTVQTTSQPLKVSSDNLKINLKNYLESFRLLNDSYNILDAVVHNFSVEVKVVAVPGAQKSNVAQSIITNLKNLLDIRKFHINQPLALGDIEYAVLSSAGVSSISRSQDHRGIRIISKSGVIVSSDGIDSFDYSLSTEFLPLAREERGYVFPHKNGIFELKYPDHDIRVSVL